MRATLDPLLATLQTRNSRIVQGDIVRDQAGELNTKTGNALEGSYLAFVALKDITDGYGEGKPGRDIPRPERERDPCGNDGRRCDIPDRDPCRQGHCTYAIPDRPKPWRDIPDYAVPEPRQRPEKK